MIEINNKETFERFVKDNQNVVAVFSAPWCGPCRMLSSVIENVEPDLEGVLFVKVNTDDAIELASEYSVQTLPTLVMFVNSSPVASKNGFMTNSALKSFVEENL